MLKAIKILMNFMEKLYIFSLGFHSNIFRYALCSQPLVEATQVIKNNSS